MIEEQIETTLKDLIPPGRGILYEMAQYSLEGGKRIRPLLTMSVLEAYGVPMAHGLRPACALEMLHTYSLIHDDLPCMDDDDERRGRPSLHRAFPESYAVLTGDFLLTNSFGVIADSPHLDSSTKLELIATLAKRAGSKGMIGGQILDIEEAGGPIEPDALKAMHLMKTASLIAASLEFGAIIANTDSAPFQEIGELLGLAFQIVDDLLDEDGMARILGKEKAQQMAEELYHLALEKIRALNRPTRELEALAEKAIFREV